MSEIYSYWWWGVVLDGTADPRVVLSYDEGETWDVCSPSFSAYVCSIFFDAVFDGSDGFGRDVMIEEWVHGERRRRFREEFRQEPTTRDLYLPATFPERFSREGQRFRFVNVNSHPQPYSNWRLWASSCELFADLVGRLSRIFPALTGLTPGKGHARSIPAGATAADIDRLYGGGDGDIPF